MYECVLKGTDHPIMKILSFTHCHVVQNSLSFSVELFDIFFLNHLLCSMKEIKPYRLGTK